MNILRILYQYIKYRNTCSIGNSSIVGKYSTFEGLNKIGSNCLFAGQMGLGSYIANNSQILGKVGRFTSIASFVRVNHYLHPYKEPYVTTSPFFFSIKSQNGATSVEENKFDEARFADSQRHYPVVIGNDCWIGEGVFVAGGITINNGAIIMAHAVVIKDVEPYSIVGGIPARIIGYRYDKETICFLEKIKWWDKSEEWLRKNSELFCDMIKFKEYFNNEL